VVEPVHWWPPRTVIIAVLGLRGSRRLKYLHVRGELIDGVDKLLNGSKHKSTFVLFVSKCIAL
jgi:hypothetical protein